MINEIHSKLKNKEISCANLVEEYLKRAKELNPNLNAYITISEKHAIEEAKRLNDMIAKTDDIEELIKKYPLLGIPIAHKDIYSTKDIETTAASNILRGYIPPYDATSVKKLKNAGAIIIGKLNCDAFAHGGSGMNSDFGPTKNPYDLEKIPGGSSSGSGVAVAADLSVIATGTDTGGSIRSPASFCNVVGLKPTYGRVSRYGVISMASSTDSIGHLTKTVEDNAKVLNITAGFDQHDATSSKTKVPNYLSSIKDGVKGLKIGLPKEYMGEGVDDQIKSVVEEATKIYKKLGAEIKEISLPHTEYALAVYYLVQPSEVSSNLGRFDGIRFGHAREKFGEEAKRRIMIGTYALSAGFYDEYYLKAQKVRTLIKQDFEKAFGEIDVILAPVSPVMPTKIGENIDNPLQLYLMDSLLVSSNLAGIPALSVPGGFDDNGMPIGIQLMGNYFDEELLYRAGYAFEQETKYYERKPKL